MVGLENCNNCTFSSVSSQYGFYNKKISTSSTNPHSKRNNRQYITRQQVYNSFTSAIREEHKHHIMLDELLQSCYKSQRHPTFSLTTFKFPASCLLQDIRRWKIQREDTSTERIASLHKTDILFVFIQVCLDFPVILVNTFYVWWWRFLMVLQFWKLVIVISFVIVIYMVQGLKSNVPSKSKRNIIMQSN